MVVLGKIFSVFGTLFLFMIPAGLVWRLYQSFKCRGEDGDWKRNRIYRGSCDRLALKRYQEQIELRRQILMMKYGIEDKSGDPGEERQED